MRLAEIVDAFRRAKPEELREVRSVLAALPEEPTRETMPIEDWRTLASQVKARAAAHAKADAAIAEGIEAAEARERKAREEAGALIDRRSEASRAFREYRDDAWTRLQAGRPMFFDELAISVRELIAEVMNTERIGEVRWPDTDLALPVGNGRSVSARLKVLNRLLEDIEERWAVEGLEETEVRRRFDETVSAAPSVVPIEEHQRQQQVALNKRAGRVPLDLLPPAA